VGLLVTQQAAVEGFLEAGPEVEEWPPKLVVLELLIRQAF